MSCTTAYVGDGFVDRAVLALIVKPSAKEPFRELSIKWAVKGHSRLAGVLMRARDVVALKLLGIATTPNGERIGYHLYYSVGLPAIRELSDFHIMRGKVSLCQLFRQRKENFIEVFTHGLLNLTGNALASLVTATVAEVPVSVRKHAHWAEMKKIVRLLDATTRMSSSSSAALASSSSLNSTCAVCGQSLGSSGLSLPTSSSSSKEEQCWKVCSARVCSRCRVSKTVYLPAEKIEKELIELNVEVCTRCILRVSCASSAAFATLDALAEKGERRLHRGALVEWCE